MNVASMFRDIIETPEQRQQRQMLERLNQAQSFMAPRGSVASLLNPLAGATFMNIAESQDRVKENLGGMLGLDMRDTGQKVSDILRNADVSNFQGVDKLSQALLDVAPAEALQLQQESALLQQKQREEQDKKNQDKLKIEAVQSYLRPQDESLADLIPTLYAGNADGAVAFASQVLKTGELPTRQQKIEDLSRILFDPNGDFNTIEQAREQAILITDGAIRLERNESNPSVASLINVAKPSESRTIRINATPADQPLEPPTDETPTQRSILERMQNTTGPYNRIGEVLGRIGEAVTGSEDMLAEQKTEDMQYLRTFESDIVRAFTLSPRFPVSEQEAVLSRISLQPGYLQGKAAAAARLAAVDAYLSEELEKSQRFLNDPQNPEDEKAEERGFVSNIREFKNKLYPLGISIEAITVDIAKNLSSERAAQFIARYSEDDLNKLTPEIIDILDEKTRQ